ncbi:ABC-2 type transporter [Haloterrigena turkmenica DSM 5511]|uniref:ABC-2 type transporter n=1 Tax=Haloterrigena turkmenica (strain ATCC 51198 / DSM 5511 / JCM 9101 / NCIMB 13204 / VKM B-1734 / 4k) TaxID=543526 RepID=D2RSU1_HALTV|nr:ABC transporter permease [Haloterrigena turkmenica]ADB58915.1 ABC-2 type transporter [Haloterrigena turkmenica DSM 5511]
MSTDAETGSANTDRGRTTAGNGFVRDTWINLKRWLIKTTRNPFVMTVSLLNPIIFLVLFTEVFGGVTEGAVSQSLGTEASYVTFLVPAIVIQTALIGATTSGIGLVDDIENGMFEKVLVSPMHRGAIFLGKSLSEVLRIVVQIGIILTLGYVLLYLDAGAPLTDYVETGVLGALGIVAVGIVFSIWFTALSNVVALVTRDQESTIIAVNLLQFPLLFLSSAFLPIEVLPEWVQTIAALNPITYGVDAARALMFGKDVMTVLEVSAFGGMWNTLVPALAVLGALDLVLGAVAVHFLNSASSSDVQ